MNACGGADVCGCGLYLVAPPVPGAGQPARSAGARAVFYVRRRRTRARAGGDLVYDPVNVAPIKPGSLGHAQACAGKILPRSMRPPCSVLALRTGPEGAGAPRGARAVINTNPTRAVRSKIRTTERIVLHVFIATGGHGK